MTIVEQLVDAYYKEEWWQKGSLSREEAIKYHEKLLEKGRIVTIDQNNELIAYVESWRVNYEQLGRILCHAPFSSFLEDVEKGNICYVQGAWIKKEYRRGPVTKLLKNLFFQQNFSCEYFVGEAMRKKTQPFKVFKRQEFYNRYIGEQKEKEGFING